jgi:pimeloyl-ACP methyl ester carboxylesterase
VSDTRTLLLIHGGLWEDIGADWFWRRPGIVAGLERLGFDVVAPDRLRRASSWTDEAAHIAAKLSGSSLLGAPVTVVGGSFGCAVAARLALDFPGVARRLLLAWPAAVADAFVATRVRADLARQGARPGVLNALLGAATLPSVTDAELGALSIPVGVLPAVPPNPVHSRGTVDALLRLLPSAVAVAGCPEPPSPEFAPHLESFLATVAAFASGGSTAPREPE